MSLDPTRNLPTPLSAELKHAAHEIGLIELTPEEIEKQYEDLNQILEKGLNRKAGEEVQKGEIAAIRTGIPVISQLVWQKVTSGTQVIVCEVAGTNFNFCLALKEQDGSISLTYFPLRSASYPLTERQISFQTFIDRIALPIAKLHNDLNNPTPLNFGISLGHYHTNEITPYGIEAFFLTTSGKLSKGWFINDWPDIPVEEKGLVSGVRKKLSALGVNVGQGIAINDTCAVALDADATIKAQNQGHRVLPASFVGGTGINAAIDQNGLVNLEMGHPLWHDNLVSKTMREQLHIEGLLDTELPEPEHEAGQYIPRRLAVGISILGKQNFLHGVENVSDQILDAIPQNPKLISDIATGETVFTENIEVNSLIRALSLGVLKRAGQTYGILFASLSKPIQREKNQTDKPDALLTEGSAIHKGYGIKEESEQVAASLGHPVKVVKAVGLKGIGALAMSWEYMNK